MARLLVVEDDPDMAELIVYSLRGEGHDVRAVGAAAPALEAFHRLRPELVVLDISLPDRSGLDVCAQIRQQSRVPILFLTGRTLLQDKARSFAVGGDDYLAKPFLTGELCLRVGALLRRAAWGAGPGGVLRVGGLEVDRGAGAVWRDGRSLPLSPMELDLILALASTPGSPWPAERLARRLGLTTTTRHAAAELMYVKISRLRRKLEPDPSAPRYIISRRGVGYLLAST